MRKDLMKARTLFEMDQFVKLTEVRGIMREALQTIYDRMTKSDDLVKQHGRAVNRMDGIVKSL